MATDNTTSPAATWPRIIAVIGGGTMGLGVAECFANAGCTVRLTDATPELTAAAHRNLLARVHGHIAAGLLPPDAGERIAAVVAAPDLAAAVADADFIFEAVPERIEVKEATFLALSDMARADAVIVSNTSSFPIRQLAAFVMHPARFLGTHWFNPPEWTPGVEIIPHATTDPAITARVIEFLRRVGKRPALVGDGPAFVANRIQMAILREAIACVEAGLGTPREVDEVVRTTFGFRLPFFGPFQLADMAGLDTTASVFATLARDLDDPAFAVPKMFTRMLAQGRVGTKAGDGFFTYTPEERAHLLLERDRRYAALSKLLAELPPLSLSEGE